MCIRDRHIPLNEGVTLRTLIEQAIDMGFSLLNSSDGLYLELVRNWHRDRTSRGCLTTAFF